MSPSKQAVLIKLHTVILDCTVPENDPHSTEQIHVNYEGTLTDTKDALELRYRETAESEMGDTHTTLVFPKEQTDLCMMVREGAINCTMSFSLSDRRQFCAYQTPFGPFSFTVVTNALSAQMEEQGGRFSVEYDLEIRGVVSQRNRLSLSVTPVTKEALHG